MVPKVGFSKSPRIAEHPVGPERGPGGSEDGPGLCALLPGRPGAPGPSFPLRPGEEVRHREGHRQGGAGGSQRAPIPILGSKNRRCLCLGQRFSTFLGATATHSATQYFTMAREWVSSLHPPSPLPRPPP